MIKLDVMTPFNSESCLKQIAPVVGAAAISAGASLLGGLFSKSDSAEQRKWASEENALNRQFQHDEAELAYNRNEQTRIAQNEWNSEPEQIKRLKQAGINPYNALSGVSGSSVVSAGNTASAGNASGSQMSYQRATDLSWIQGMANAGLVAAQTRKLNAETDNLNSQTKGVDLANAFQDMFNNNYREFGRLEKILDLDLKDTERAKNEAQTSLTKAQEKLSQYDLSKIKPAEYQEIFSNILRNRASAYADLIQAAKTNEERISIIRKRDAEIGLIVATAAEKWSQIELNRSNVGLNQNLAQESQGRQRLNFFSAADSKLSYTAKKYMVDNLLGIYTESQDTYLRAGMSHYGRFVHDGSLSNKTWSLLNFAGHMLPLADGIATFGAPTLVGFP